MMPDTRW